MLTKEFLEKIGFKESLMGYMKLSLNRNRFLVIGFFGTPNEILFITHEDEESDDVIVLHNWDYDGYLTEVKIQILLQCIGTSTSKTKNIEN